MLVGHRLGTKLEAHPGVIARLDGATVTEDVPAVLNRLMDALHTASRQLSGDGAALFGLAHDAEGEPTLKRLLPLAPPQAPRLSHPPRLQLAPAGFFAELLDQYLLAALYGLLYESLAAENRQRLAHMEHALDRLDETVARLALKRNALRQEKIVEEIEVILSSEQAFAKAQARPTSSSSSTSPSIALDEFARLDLSRCRRASLGSAQGIVVHAQLATVSGWQRSQLYRSSTNGGCINRRSFIVPSSSAILGATSLRGASA